MSGGSADAKGRVCAYRMSMSTSLGGSCGIYIPVMMMTLSWTRGLLEPAATLAMGGRSWEVRASMRFSAFDLSDMMGGLCVCYEGVGVKIYNRWAMDDIGIFSRKEKEGECNKMNVYRKSYTAVLAMLLPDWSSLQVSISGADGPRCRGSAVGKTRRGS